MTLQKFQKTPLILASERGFLSVIKCLMEHGADINATREDGVKPYQRNSKFYQSVSNSSHSYIADKVFESSAFDRSKETLKNIKVLALPEVYNKESWKTTASKSLVIVNDTKNYYFYRPSIAQKSGLILKKIVLFQSTSLHVASSKGYFDILEYLIDKKAKIELKNKDKVKSNSIFFLCNFIIATTVVLKKC